MEEAMHDVGLEELETYISLRQNTMDLYIATRPILYLCLEVDRKSGSGVERRWWNQEGIYFTVAWGDVEAEETGETEGKGNVEAGN